MLLCQVGEQIFLELAQNSLDSDAVNLGELVDPSVLGVDLLECSSPAHGMLELVPLFS